MTLEELRAAYPSWLISQSGTGRYWANRHGTPTTAQLAAGAVVHLDADTGHQLDNLLDHQEHIRRSIT